MIGSRLGPYEIVAELGSGGMGKVYRATVTKAVAGLEAGTAVALKVIHAHLLEQEGFFQRFLREADIGRSVEHENVIRTYVADALLHEGVQHNFLVMEYVAGQTLRDLLNELERVPEELCRHIGREVAKGLQAIHEAGVVHRDLKPENVLITPDHVVKVMDLGVARLQAEVVRLSQTGAFVGSLEYAAPEQFRSGGEEVDARSDLHALGVLLYELSTGRHPYRDEDPSKVLRNILHEAPRKAGELNPQLSPFFEEVVQTLLQKDRAQRFPDASALAAVLDEGEEGAWWKERAKALRIETKRPLRRIRIPRETALYGRDDDLARLRRAYDEAQAGDGQVLLIEGEAGIGKTRLVDEFVGRLRQEGEKVHFLFGSYPPGGAATAAGAFSTAYREHFGEEGLEETLRDYLTVTPVLVPAFAALLKGDSTPTGAEPLTKDSLQTVFVHATRGLAAERTTIVLIDDLHFAPEDGRAIFSSLALAVPEHRILLLGTMRPGVPEAWTSDITHLAHAEHRTLSRLGAKDLTHLLREAFRSERLAEELAYRIAQKSDGNPFFTFEIIQGLREGLFITQQPDGTWVSTRAIQEIQVPSSVQDLVRARIADLDDAERELLDVASCCGFEFDPGLVADALGEKTVPTLRKLARLEAKHRLVRASGRRFVFDHHQVQEALYQALPAQLLEAYHRSLAEALEARAGAAETDPSALDGDLCVDLCEHYLRAAEGERAHRYLIPALDHLDRGYLNDQAVSLAREALGVPDLLAGRERVEALFRIARALDALGRRDEQGAALEEAVDLADAIDDAALRSRAHRILGACHWSAARYEDARRETEEALELSRAIGDVDGEAAARINEGSRLTAVGRDREAEPVLEAGMKLAIESGNARWEANAAGALGNAMLALGRYDEAKVWYEKQLALCRAEGDRIAESIGVGNLGRLSFAWGRFEEAKAHHEASLAIARETGQRRSEAMASSLLGNACGALDQFQEARTHHERCLAISREIGDRPGEGSALSNLAGLCKRRGDLARARALYERALAVGEAIGNPRFEANVIVNLANVTMGEGAHEEASRQLERAIAIYRAIRDPAAEATAVGNLGLARMMLGHYADARVHLERQLALARELGARLGEAIALVNLGPLWLVLGQTEKARELLEASLAICRETKARYPEGYALSTLGYIAADEGDLARAEALAREALALRREIGHADGVVSSLTQLGDLLLQTGDVDGARRALEEAVDVAGEHGGSGAAPALALLARLPGGDVDAAVEALERAGDRGSAHESRFQLWKATKDPAHLAEAKRLLDHLVEHAPEEYRASMLENVRLHRDIMEAWVAHGGEA